MMLDGFDLSGRVALVTGGSTGIGKAIAMLLAERGADVAIVARRADRLEPTAAMIREATGRRCTAIAGDVTDPGAVAAMIADVARQFGRLDILVNNAGGAGRHQGLSKLSPEHWDYDVRLNLSSAQYCSQAALPHLVESGHGAIVNISSLAGMHGTQGVGAYSAAKAGLNMLTRVHSAEWGPRGLRVNCVAPGMIATEKARRGWEKSGFDAMAACQSFPLRRPGEPNEVAQAVVFLVSDAASYITGETLTVGGGPQIKGMVEVD
jgi:NAD(P)-dependent dehydrogenase (short-subunit alcohol dehydrogenase family)